MENIFVPHELKTIEVDTEKKIFRVNGEDFGKGCDGFSITCSSYRDFKIRMDINATVRYIRYEDGKITEDRQGIPLSGGWVDNLEKSCD